MKKTSETIVFFGSGPVAAKSLELLYQTQEIEAVITKPQPAHHREAFPVLSVAQKLGLPSLTPDNSKDLSALFATRPVQSRLGLVIDYGIVIHQSVIDYFMLGIINSHFSLLPRWRGADPISFVILNGDEETGVSLMLIVEALDEGPVLAQAKLPLSPYITMPQLTDKLIMLSHSLLKQTLPMYLAGQLTARPQDKTITPSYSRKLTKADGIIDWQKPAVRLEREIRAFLEWPSSRARLGKIDVLITKASVITQPSAIQTVPGRMHIKDRQLLIETGSDLLNIERLIPAGKPEMTAVAFLAGYKLT